MTKPLIRIIKSALLSEKGLSQKEKFNQVTFRVALDANKLEIKKSLEKEFKISVQKVATLRVRGKEKRLGRHKGRRPDWKKAVITMKKGDKIEYFEGA